MMIEISTPRGPGATKGIGRIAKAGILALAFSVALSGCRRVDAPTDPNGGGQVTSEQSDEVASTGSSEADRVFPDGWAIDVDPDTKCQYIRLYGNALVPRTVVEDGVQKQAGCE